MKQLLPSLLKGVRCLHTLQREVAHKNTLLLTLGTPSQKFHVHDPIKNITLPGRHGVLTVTNNHRQSIVQLKPGVVTVNSPDKSTTYFMSDGYLFFTSASDDSGCCKAEVSAVEMFPLEALSKAEAQKVLAELTAVPKITAWDKARFLFAQDMLNTLIHATS